MARRPGRLLVSLSVDWRGLAEGAFAGKESGCVPDATDLVEEAAALAGASAGRCAGACRIRGERSERRKLRSMAPRLSRGSGASLRTQVIPRENNAPVQ